MYPPISIVQIARYRETELVRKAQRYGKLQVQPAGTSFPATLVPIVISITIFLAALALLVW